MAIDPLQELQGMLNAGSPVPGGVDLAELLIDAEDLLAEYIRANATTDPPTGIVTRAQLAVAQSLYYQRQPGGLINTGYGVDGDAISVRTSRDPLDAARPLLAQWCTPLGFA